MKRKKKESKEKSRNKLNKLFIILPAIGSFVVAIFSPIIAIGKAIMKADFHIDKFYPIEPPTAIHGSPPPEPGTPPPRTETSHFVKMVIQVILREAGFNPGPIDGIIGENSRTAIRQFQKNHRLPETGFIDKETLKALHIQPFPISFIEDRLFSHGYLLAINLD